MTVDGNEMIAGFDSRTRAGAARIYVISNNIRAALHPNYAVVRGNKLGLLAEVDPGKRNRSGRQQNHDASGKTDLEFPVHKRIMCPDRSAQPSNKHVLCQRRYLVRRDKSHVRKCFGAIIEASGRLDSVFWKEYT